MDALFGERSISLKALTDFSRIDAPTRRHLKNVYGSLAIAAIAAAGGAAIHLFTNFMKGGFLAAIAGIGLLIMLSITPNESKNQLKRLGYLSGFAMCTGLGLGPLMDRIIQIDPSIIPTAFLGTCMIFVCFSLSALKAQDRSYLYLGGSLMSGLSILCVLGLLNIFLGSQLLFQIHLYGGLLLFCGFILYDTQLIIEKRRNGDTDFIWHSVDLFLDFINVFRRLMIIMGQNKENKKKKN